MAEARKTEEDILESQEVFIGKDVLELLGSSMYVNPLMVFREYVQNSADAIDDAIRAGLLESTADGRIEINLDHIDRSVVIRDNGIGLSNAEFPGRMLSFGASAKRGTDARGFRGVGRLSALGYVQKLVFRGRAKGEPKVMGAIWDGRIIKKLLGSTEPEHDLQSIVKEAVTLNQLEPEGYPEHFFEVEFIKPRRIANDRLLNEAEITNFIAQICPCPFSPEFTYRNEINSLLAPHGRACQVYNIHVNDAEHPVYRPYVDEISYSRTKKALLGSLKSFEIKNNDGGLSAIGWLVHHDYQGAIPVAQGVRGLRARVGNIQVGHDRLFHQVFPEDRFCSWSIGEVHILDRRVIPNGRRDGFESNTHLDNIIVHLRPIGAEVAQECRTSSQKRNRQKTFEQAEDKVHEKLDVLKQGAVSADYIKTTRKEIDTLLTEMHKVTGFDLFEEEDRQKFKNQVSKIEETVESCTEKTAGNALDRLPQDKQAIYKEIFELIYDCSVNQVTAKSLIDRMIDRLSCS